MSIEQRIDRLTREIDTFRIEFEKFFAGARSVPPNDLSDEIRNEIRVLRAEPGAQLADNFRISQIEARFNSFSELFNRRVREQEVARPTAASTMPQQRRVDVDRGVVVHERVAPEVARELYAGLAKDPANPPRFDLDHFTQYLAQQVDTIRRKTGCSQVRFRLAEEGGRVKLKAKPLSGGSR